MRLHDLPEKQKEALKRAFQKERNPNEKLRYQALWLLTQQYTWKQVEEIVGKSERTLVNWVKAYKKSGLSALKQKGYPGNNHKLSREQKQEIKTLINAQTPQQAGLEGRFWNAQLLKQFVKQKYQVEFASPDSYRRLFHYCGFTYHKPTKVNKRQKDGMIKRFEVKLKKSSEGTKEKMVWYW
jgi:putative transposase